MALLSLEYLRAISGYQNWIHFNIDHKADKFPELRNSRLNGQGVYVYGLDGKCIYVGCGRIKSGHTGNRFLCHYNEASCGKPYYQKLFGENIVFKFNNKDVLLPNGNRSSINQVRFFSNIRIKQNISIYYLVELDPYKRLKIRSKLKAKLKPIYFTAIENISKKEYENQLNERINNY